MRPAFAQRACPNQANPEGCPSALKGPTCGASHKKNAADGAVPMSEGCVEERWSKGCGGGFEGFRKRVGADGRQEGRVGQLVNRTSGGAADKLVLLCRCLGPWRHATAGSKVVGGSCNGVPSINRQLCKASRAKVAGEMSTAQAGDMVEEGMQGSHDIAAQEEVKGPQRRFDSLRMALVMTCHVWNTAPACLPPAYNALPLSVSKLLAPGTQQAG